MSDYIVCGICCCKHKADSDSISNVLGYNRLGNVYKVCRTCRDDNRERYKEYYKKYKHMIDEIHKAKTACEYCGAVVNRNSMKIHQTSIKCKTAQ